MKEAISNAAVFNLIIIFVIILIAFFVGSLSYSKAFKVKNKIIEEIEKEAEYTEDPEKAYDRAEAEILEWLDSGNDGIGIGYRQNTNPGHVNSCPNENAPGGASISLVNGTSNYEYCVYRITTGYDGGKCDTDEERCYVYYRVITYMYFDVHIVEDLIRIPVTSETMSFTKVNT